MDVNPIWPGAAVHRAAEIPDSASANFFTKHPAFNNLEILPNSVKSVHKKPVASIFWKFQQNMFTNHPLLQYFGNFIFHSALQNLFEQRYFF